MNKTYDKVKAQKIHEVLGRSDEFDFSELICMLRTAIGVTQKSLALDTQIPDWKIHNWETGKFVRCPRYDSLVSLADYFGIPAKLLKKKAKQFQAAKKSCK